MLVHFVVGALIPRARLGFQFFGLFFNVGLFVLLAFDLGLIKRLAFLWN
jgi:hypothetical protein